MTIETSCGAVVFTGAPTDPRFLIIQQTNEDFGFPKGHMEGNETETETALREIWEETGLRVTLLPGFRVVDEYPLPNKPDVLKRVVFFAGRYEAQTPIYQEAELSGLELMTYDQAMAALSFDSTRTVLKEAHRFIKNI